MAERVLAGRYRVQRLLGRGGMAEVFEAHDAILARQVAVKLLLDRFADDDRFVDRFRREARNAASLNHPHIVGVYDTGEHDGLPFIVMELVRGRSLQAAIADGGLTEDRALEVCAEVATALAYAHQRGLVHRDIKPGNILLADDGTVKVTDFGIARAIDTGTVTQTAAVLGTASYLSPEQAQGQPADVRSDLYSLGVVLYEALTHQVPFAGDSPVTVAYQHVQELPRPPRDWDPGISSAAEAIAMRAMAKNPANRYQSAEELRDDLLRAGAGQAVSAPAVLHAADTVQFDAPARARTPAAQRRRRAFGYALLAVATVLVASAVVFFGARSLTGAQTQRIEVPDLRNRTVAEVQEILQQRDLEPRFVDEVFSDTVAVGRVARQRPSPLSLVEQGATVELALSAGREQVEVPDVTGASEEDARAALRDRDLVPTGRAEVFSDELPAGAVVATDPPGGTEVPLGTSVALTVSAGPDLVSVPAVVSLTEAEAGAALRDDGFVPLVVREFSDEVETGRVIREDPGAGVELERGAEVTLVVSRGPSEPIVEPPPPEPEPPPEPDGPPPGEPGPDEPPPEAEPGPDEPGPDEPEPEPGPDDVPPGDAPAGAG